uniref:Uncharacterized protein n=1 Tax=Solanum lycopersicum TaxID=4081 RepID=A0A3Q7IVK4_SOLLC
MKGGERVAALGTAGSCYSSCCPAAREERRGEARSRGGTRLLVAAFAGGFCFLELRSSAIAAGRSSCFEEKESSEFSLAALPAASPRWFLLLLLGKRKEEKRRWGEREKGRGKRCRLVAACHASPG